jgi:bleomycin hydrolase
MSKKNKLIYRNSIMTHAMVFTGYDSKERNNNVSQCMEEDITKWRVENSWDAKGIQKGYYTMSQDWFREYVYEVVIHKSYLDKNLLEVMNGEVPVKDLPPWDPMGSLA